MSTNTGEHGHGLGLSHEPPRDDLWHGNHSSVLAWSVMPPAIDRHEEMRPPVEPEQHPHELGHEIIDIPDEDRMFPSWAPKVIPVLVLLAFSAFAFAQDVTPRILIADSDQQAKRLDEHDARLDRIEAALLQLVEGQQQQAASIADAKAACEALNQQQKKQQLDLSDLDLGRQGYEQRRVQSQQVQRSVEGYAIGATRTDSRGTWTMTGINQYGYAQWTGPPMTVQPAVQAYSAPVQSYSQPAVQYQAAPAFQSGGGYSSGFSGGGGGGGFSVGVASGGS